jgi:probable rRNA maturation factor
MKKTRKSRLQIEIANEAWKNVKGLTKRLEQASDLTLAVLPAPLLPAAKQAQMTLLLTTDKAVQTLNHDYRGLNKPTNVLSFPHYERRELIKLGKRGEPLYVGDIAVAYQYMAKEARVEHKILLDHLTHLLIHGVLHLFGYDHDTSGKAARMESLEKQVMATLGLPDPYAEMNETCRSAKRKK